MAHQSLPKRYAIFPWNYFRNHKLKLRNLIEVTEVYIVAFEDKRSNQGKIDKTKSQNVQILDNANDLVNTLKLQAVDQSTIL